MNVISRINRKSYRPNWWLLVISMLCVYWPIANVQAQDNYSATTSVMATTSIPLRGVANGGELVLAEALNRNMRTAVIETKAGESAELVARRLAEYIDENNPFEWGGFQRGQKRITAEGGTLRGLAGSQYVFSGTETGLGIPMPPYSLTCTVDTKETLLLLSWENPPGAYDNIAIVYNWTNFYHTGSDVIEGNATFFARDLSQRPLDTSDLDVWIIGFRNGTPSNASAIHVSGNGRVQEELFGIPFTNGIAPNWTTWVTAGDKNAVRFEKRVRDQFVHAEGRTSNRITHPATKPFYQVIKVTSPTAVAGVKRKFLGLAPGHTYRISARLSTLELDSAKENWSFSLHAAYNAPAGADLAVEQLSGVAALPDGSKGATAGRIALYEPGLTTNGTWEERSTGKEWRGLVAPDISLPPSMDTLTVWVRHRGVDSTGVGIDWVKIEDLSVLPDKSQR